MDESSERGLANTSLHFRDLIARKNLDGLGDCFKLLRAKLLPGLEIRSLLLTSRSQVSQVLLICLFGCGCVTEIRICLCLGLELLGLCLCFFSTICCCLVDLSGKVLNQHFKCMLGVHLLFFHLGPFLNECVQKLLKHLDDAMRLKFISVSLGCRNIKRVRGLLQERSDRLFLPRS